MIQIVNLALINIKETVIFAIQGITYFTEFVNYVMIQIVYHVLINMKETAHYATQGII